MRISRLFRKPVPLLYCAFFLVFTILPNVSSAETNGRAVKILGKIDNMWRGESSKAVISMKVKTAHYTRTMKMEAWSKGKDKTLVRITYPLKEKGTTTLKSGESIYTYLPKTDRTIRLTSGMMTGSWMGSHFTNDDLVKESRLTDDYNVSIAFEGMRDGQNVIEFTLLPKEEAAVVWGKIDLTVIAIKNIPLREVYYDEDMEPVRDILFEKVKNLGGREIPSVMKVLPKNKPSEFTELVYETMEFGNQINDSFFSLSRLRRK
ncbi:Outer membrane lipoprotein-sorting protein [hydrothermal vent metagenome]|uniref:Outer membrane lipoprotein-sorting protein n=1 Tax=hydrothermal vent metagenome TaxID=652676 RepID=A0A3B1C3C3_9ZZZZ